MQSLDKRKQELKEILSQIKNRGSDGKEGKDKFIRKIHKENTLTIKIGVGEAK